MYFGVFFKLLLFEYHLYIFGCICIYLSYYIFNIFLHKLNIDSLFKKSNLVLSNTDSTN